jgi:hypothetical protein
MMQNSLNPKYCPNFPSRVFVLIDVDGRNSLYLIEREL